MSAILRQNTLFVSEDWSAAYDALTQVDFRSADYDTLRAAMVEYLRLQYPEEFNDWIGSNEFIIKIDILAWLAQNINWRVDLSSRENFLATAERRESLLRLAYNIAYSVNRVRPATGEVKIESVRTNEIILDTDNQSLSGREIIWNDNTSNPDWFEQWTLIMNRAFNGRCRFGRPVRRYTEDGSRLELYQLNSLAPGTGAYPFQASVGGQGLQFDIVNVDIDQADGTYAEVAPNPSNSFRILYRTDGRGNGSTGTGFFLPIRQGTMGYQDETFTDAVSARVVNVDVPNINQTDIYVEEVDADGNVLHVWDRVDSSYGVGVAFNSLDSTDTKIYEVITRSDDQVAIRFGDGKFGEIPVGRFRIWYRTSSPFPRVVKPSDIQKKTVTIPYVSNNVIYNLTLTFSLQDNITNAAASETDSDIRTRANKVYYSGDRMVSGQDYNSYFLKDNSILKVKAVNRTYSGHGRSVPLNDPTGTYQSVKLIADDGRIYKVDVEGTDTVSANTDILVNDELITDHILPKIQTKDKARLYDDNYEEIPLSTAATWTTDSVVNGYSRGRFMRSAVAQSVGSSASTSDQLWHIGTNCLVRFTDASGDLIPVNYVVAPGTATNGVLLKGLADNGATVFSVFPALRQSFTTSEREAIEDQLELKASFGIRWDQTTETWDIIALDDLDTSGPFSLEHAGDTTSAGLDASWMVWLEYVPVGGGSDDEWNITHRGSRIYFESDREVDFYYADTETIYDPATGLPLRDNIKILRDNQSRDSAARLGTTSQLNNISPGTFLSFTGNGSRRQFSLGTSGITQDELFVTKDGIFQIPTLEYTLDLTGINDITFPSAPANGIAIEARLDRKSSYFQHIRLSFTGDGTTTEYAMATTNLYGENQWAFVNGLFKRAGSDMEVYDVLAGSAMTFASPPSNGHPITVMRISGVGPAFLTNHYLADGSDVSFGTGSNNIDTTKIWAFVDGVLKVHGTDYTLTDTSTDNVKVTFSVAPSNGAKVAIRTSLFPRFLRLADVTHTANGSTATFSNTGVTTGSSLKSMVFVDGVFQHTITYTNGSPDSVTLPSNPSNGSKVRIITFLAAAATDAYMLGALGDSFFGLDFTAQPTFLDSDQAWNVDGLLLHDDGYVNPNGISLVQVDEDGNGVYDDPFVFESFVVEDGRTDLVLWRRIEENGYDIWDPISLSTVPRGTHENEFYDYHAGDAFDPDEIDPGSVHYDLTNDVWLVADGDLEEWAEAEDQDAYRKEIGRSGLRFMWTHYAPDSNRIDPSASNINDVFVLTSGYDSAVRDWIAEGGSSATRPVPSTTDELRIQYQEFEDHRMTSDAIVWRPARYKLLFGAQADAAVRATFQVVRMPGSSVPDNDLKLRILGVIDDYFEVGLWDFGESFYYTELAAYIHQQLASMVQSVVIVPDADDETFGRLFQVRCEPDELFISCATADDISVVDSLTDSRLKIR